MKKNPDNSDAIGFSGVTVDITNRLRMLLDTLPDIHVPNQLQGSSDIGVFEDGGPVIKVKFRSPLPPSWTEMHALEEGSQLDFKLLGRHLQMDLSSSCLGVG